MGFDMMFGFMGFFVPVVMVLIFGLILFQIGRGVKQWNKNNNSPVLSVDAQVVAKRTQVSHHHQNNQVAGTFTTYYATFQVESGDRMEFAIRGTEYGLLAEGDRGKLTFQGWASSGNDPLARARKGWKEAIWSRFVGWIAAANAAGKKSAEDVSPREAIRWAAPVWPPSGSRQGARPGSSRKKKR